MLNVVLERVQQHLTGVVEEYDSSIFAIAYTPGYAMGNILLTVLGPLVVAICIH